MAIFRVGLIGCGLISEAHVDAYRPQAQRARITVCCDVDLKKATERAASVGDARAVSNWQEVVADPDVDAVEICTPHHLHSEIAVAAARAGKHILCQKPLARTVAECQIMQAAAHESGVTLFYGETNRTWPVIREARRLIDTGRIGQVVGVQATYAHHQGGRYLETAWRYDPSVAGGGQLVDGGIHWIDVLLHLGGPVQSVTAFATRFRPELGGEDTAVVNLRYESGGLGSFFSSHAAHTWYTGPNCVVFGTDGALIIGGPLGALTLRRNDLPDRQEIVIKSGGNSFHAMIAAYLDTVLDGAPNPAPADVALADLAVVLAAYKSVETGREIPVDEITG